jgi:DNA (cytosine-5)-methyltransferase 1
MTDLTAVSLFAGVGGFDLAMERNGINVVATVEIDKAARGVLQHRFPNNKHFDDVTKVRGDDLRAAGFIPERGIITGGFPCQDLSVAGKRVGLAGERSGLFFEIVRLLDELQPKHLVLENVPGLLSSYGGRDMGIVLGALVQCGYGVSYRVLDAQFFGVAQRRRRVFIVGCLGDDGAASSEILALSEGVSGDTPKGRKARQELAEDAGQGVAGSLTAAGIRCDLNKASSGHLITHDVVGTLKSRHYKGVDHEGARDGHLVVREI